MKIETGATTRALITFRLIACDSKSKNNRNLQVFQASQRTPSASAASYAPLSSSPSSMRLSQPSPEGTATTSDAPLQTVPPPAPEIVPAGTMLPDRVTQEPGSKTNSDPLETGFFRLDDKMLGSVGTQTYGVVTEALKAGGFKGRAALGVALVGGAAGPAESAFAGNRNIVMKPEPASSFLMKKSLAI